MNNFDMVARAMQCYRDSAVDERISPNDSMNGPAYFDVGRHAVDAITAALLASRTQEVHRVLDVPCGHGRVLRHLVKLFPDAAIDACDLDEDGVAFCASTFGARAIPSRKELSEVDFGSTYNLIWVGSLFTHTAEDVTRRWLAHLARFLAEDGIVVATLHGRFCERRGEVKPYISPDAWRSILDGYRRTGYGYRDYPSGVAPGFIAGSYGISLVRPDVMIQMIEQIPGVRIFSYIERGWGDYHDVLAFGRPAHDEPWPGMEEVKSPAIRPARPGFRMAQRWVRRARRRVRARSRWKAGRATVTRRFARRN
jgi:SAM-dependent methyltransferase